MTVHRLKTIEPYFTDVLVGVKNFEVRRNDRGFKRGDVLVLERYEDGDEGSDRPSIARICCYVLEGGQYGIAFGYVVLGLGYVVYNVEDFE